MILVNWKILYWISKLQNLGGVRPFVLGSSEVHGTLECPQSFDIIAR